MKTLVNKDNPQIRITAPDGMVKNRTNCWAIWSEGNRLMLLDKDQWTLVEEPENISWADRLKERLENMTQEEFEKAMNEMYVDGDESPTLEEYLKVAYHSPIKQKPEWSEEDEEHLKWLCRIIRSCRLHEGLSLKEESELGKWIDKWINHEPQQENKWSEFDEDCLKRAIWYVENPAPSVVKDTNLVLWLNSLKDRGNFPKSNTNSPSEWSEEDKHRCKDAIYFLETAKKHYADTSEIELTIEWLKSLRPSWKPSEEQMRALWEIYQGGEAQAPIASLYEDLKKL